MKSQSWAGNCLNSLVDKHEFPVVLLVDHIGFNDSQLLQHILEWFLRNLHILNVLAHQTNVVIDPTFQDLSQSLLSSEAIVQVLQDLSKDDNHNELKRIHLSSKNLTRLPTKKLRRLFSFFPLSTLKSLMAWSSDRFFTWVPQHMLLSKEPILTTRTGPARSSGNPLVCAYFMTIFTDLITFQDIIIMIVLPLWGLDHEHPQTYGRLLQDDREWLDCTDLLFAALVPLWCSVDLVRCKRHPPKAADYFETSIFYFAHVLFIIRYFTRSVANHSNKNKLFKLAIHFSESYHCQSQILRYCMSGIGNTSGLSKGTLNLDQWFKFSY